MSTRVRNPVFEIGCDAASNEIVDVARWRAVLWDEIDQYEGSYIGWGKGTYYLRAQLPYGVWKNPNDLFNIDLDTVVPR